jgi:release factor glutamine methyltransferase
MKCITKRPLFDIIFCNPPYVPSDDVNDIRKSGDMIDLSWAGGINGRQIIDSFIRMGEGILSDSGVMYLLVVQQNDPDSIIEYSRDLGLVCTVRFMAS